MDESEQKEGFTNFKTLSCLLHTWYKVQRSECFNGLTGVAGGRSNWGIFVHLDCFNLIRVVANKSCKRKSSDLLQLL